MSAIPEEFIRRTAQLSEEATRPYPNSRKLLVPGSRPDIRVGMQSLGHHGKGDGLGVPAGRAIQLRQVLLLGVLPGVGQGLHLSHERCDGL